MTPQIWHLITSEYPLQIGGVSDYTYLVAGGLAATGDEVHVWCPQSTQETPSVQGVTVHRELGQFDGNDLRHAGEMLNQFPSPRHLLVQWVPHGYGYNSMNFQFCIWLWKRAARARDYIDLMVHEPFLAFREGSLKQDAAAFAHRLMTIILLRAARKVWVSIPNWEACLRPYSTGRHLPFSCLPVPSNVPVIENSSERLRIRDRYAPEGGFLIGHFGTYGREVAKLLMKSLPTLLSGGSNKAVLLIGQGSKQFRIRLIAEHPELTELVQATGPLVAADVSRHLAACDLMFQPYPDGINGRHGSAMAGLAHGLPMVTTSGHLTESFWIASGAAAIAAVRDPAIVALVECLLKDPTERTRLGQAAAALYQERFDVRNTIAALRQDQRYLVENTG